MGLWKKFKKAVKKVTKKVAKTVKKVVEKVGDAVSDVVETVGNGIRDGLNAIGGALGKIPVVGKVLKGAFRWVGGIVSGIFDVAAAVIKGVFGFVGNVIGGAIKIVGGIISLDGGLIKEGFLDIASSLVGGVILIVGKAVSVIQTTLFLEKDRPLTREEKAMLRRVFRESVALYNVRVVDGFAGLYSLNSRPFTLGNKIYLKGTDTTKRPDVLVHETVHVWQNQHQGARYIGDALGAQMFVDDAYSWVKELGRGKMKWSEFNAEAQAELVDDVYTDGELLTGGVVTATGNGAFFDADGKKTIGRFKWEKTDYTELANDATQTIRGETPFRLSGLFS